MSLALVRLSRSGENSAPVLLIIALLVLIPLVAARTSFAQKGPENNRGGLESLATTRIRGLNNSLLQLHEQIQEAEPAEAESIRSQAKTVIAARAVSLSALIEEDPRTALSFAFSPELLDELTNMFRSAASLLETHGTWQGPIEVRVVDYPAPAPSKTTVRMNVGGQWLDVHFADGSSANLQSGDVLQAIGVQVGSAMVASKSTLQASTTTSPGRDKQ